MRKPKGVGVQSPFKKWARTTDAQIYWDACRAKERETLAEGNPISINAITGEIVRVADDYEPGLYKHKNAVTGQITRFGRDGKFIADPEPHQFAQNSNGDD